MPVQHVLTYLKQISSQCDQIHNKTHPHCMYRLDHIRETFYSANDMKELFQNIEIKKCNLIPKSDKYIRRNLKEISGRLNFSYKLFLYKKYFKKSDPFHELLKNHFYYNTILYK